MNPWLLTSLGLGAFFAFKNQNQRMTAAYPKSHHMNPYDKEREDLYRALMNQKPGQPTGKDNRLKLNLEVPLCMACNTGGYARGTDPSINQPAPEQQQCPWPAEGSGIYTDPQVHTESPILTPADTVDTPITTFSPNSSNNYIPSGGIDLTNKERFSPQKGSSQSMSAAQTQAGML